MGFRDVLPASLAEVVQNGLLDGVFRDALAPALLWDNVAEEHPWSAGLGATMIMTRNGLMPVNTVPVTGGDATTTSYGFEQFVLTMDQWGSSKDTNMVGSAIAQASLFVKDNQVLGINAAQTINALAQNALYGAYGTGQTWATAGSTSSTSLHVDNASGFAYAVQMSTTTNSNPGSGNVGVSVPVLVPVSGSAPISVTINGVANTVVGASLTTNVLTLGTAISATTGWDVINLTGPVILRPNGRATGNDLISTDLATLQLIESGVTRLRLMNIPRIRGAYTAHIHPNTLEELFQDTAFRQVFQTRSDSAAYRDLTLGADVGDNIEFIGRFAGCDFFLNNLVPTYTNLGGVPYYRPVLCGQECLMKGPFRDMGSLISETHTGSTVEIQMVDGVARIWRAPLDRFGQVYSSTWSWIGGWSVGTDMLTGDSAVYKRAVVLEHA